VVPEIAAITGHSLADVEAILDAHYLGRTTKLAVSGMAKLERASGGNPNVPRTKSAKHSAKHSDRSK